MNRLVPPTADRGRLRIPYVKRTVLFVSANSSFERLEARWTRHDLHVDKQRGTRPRHGSRHYSSQGTLCSTPRTRIRSLRGSHSHARTPCSLSTRDASVVAILALSVRLDASCRGRGPGHRGGPVETGDACSRMSRCVSGGVRGDLLTLTGTRQSIID